MSSASLLPLLFLHSNWSRGSHLDEFSWWRHQMEIFPALLAWPLVMGIQFPSQRAVTRSFDVFIDLQNGFAKNRDTGDLRHHRIHCDVTVMFQYLATPGVVMMTIPGLACRKIVNWQLFVSVCAIATLVYIFYFFCDWYPHQRWRCDNVFTQCVCVFICYSLCWYERFSWEGLVPHRQYVQAMTVSCTYDVIGHVMWRLWILSSIFVFA